VAISRLSKVFLVSAALVGLLAWLIIVELGVNAGRIHYGVQLRGDLKLGGMTRAEARDVLHERAEEMLYEPVVLGAEGIGPIRVYPRKPDPDDSNEKIRAVGWNPRYTDTLDALMDVGRKNAPFGALADRVGAYFGGVKVAWQGAPEAYRVGKVIDYIEREAGKQGLELDRPALRIKIRQALNEYPRQPFYRIPVE
jgi:hypothetical protein